MADGTGEDSGMGPSLADLKQLAWDIAYIQSKLAHNGVFKTFIVRRNDGYQFILGKISFVRWDWRAGIRYMADRIAAGDDGPAPLVENFGQSSQTMSALEALHSDIAAVLVSQAYYNKRTFTMRVMPDGLIEMTIGGLEAVNSTYRLAFKSLDAQLAAGQN